MSVYKNALNYTDVTDERGQMREVRTMVLGVEEIRKFADVN